MQLRTNFFNASELRFIVAAFDLAGGEGVTLEPLAESLGMQDWEIQKLADEMQERGVLASLNSEGAGMFTSEGKQFAGKVVLNPTYWSENERRLVGQAYVQWQRGSRLFRLEDFSFSTQSFEEAYKVRSRMIGRKVLRTVTNNGLDIALTEFESGAVKAVGLFFDKLEPVDIRAGLTFTLCTIDKWLLLTLADSSPISWADLVQNAVYSREVLSSSYHRLTDGGLAEDIHFCTTIRFSAKAPRGVEARPPSGVPRLTKKGSDVVAQLRSSRQPKPEPMPQEPSASSFELVGTQSIMLDVAEKRFIVAAFDVAYSRDRNAACAINLSEAGKIAGFDATRSSDIAISLQSRRVFLPQQSKQEAAFTPESQEFAQELSQIPLYWPLREQQSALENFREWRKSRKPFHMREFGITNQERDRMIARRIWRAVDLEGHLVTFSDKGKEIFEGWLQNIRSRSERPANIGQPHYNALIGARISMREPDRRVAAKSIFISHAVADKAIADALVDLMVLPGCVSHDEIFCSSLEGMGIPEGSNFIEFIRQQLQHPHLVVMLISPHYFESAFCLCELGASWAMSLKSFPLVIPPMTFADLKAVLTGVQAGRIDDEAILNNLKDAICELTETTVSTARWEKKRDEILVKLKPLLKTVASPSKVSFAKFKELEDKYVVAMADAAKQKDLITQLEAIKDAEEVAALKKTNDTEWEKFQVLVQAAKSTLFVLAPSVRNVLFHEYAHLKFEPTDDERERLKKMRAQDFVTFDPHEGWKTNASDTQVNVAISAVNDVVEFMETQSEDFGTMFESQYRFLPKISNQRFWNKLFHAGLKD